MSAACKGCENVELGFLVSPQDNWCIWDSAKFGGKPCWLIPNIVPSAKEVTCSHCQKVMCFMMQLYNPCDERDDLWHRSIYVFVCRSQECLEKGSIKVLRCQLHRINDFYPEEVDKEYQMKYFNPRSKCSPFFYGIHLCNVCGLKATSKCAKCSVYYCCREHQVIAWSNSHKEECNNVQQSISSLYSDSKVFNNVQFPLWEVDIVPEPAPTQQEVSEELEERARLNRFAVADGPITITDKDIRDAMGGRLEDDPIRLHFNKVLNRANTQILRINRWNNNAILWANSDTMLDHNDIPQCINCGSLRKFEFQIMPQLIYLLGTNKETKTEYPEIDFGSLVVYTCCSSCQYIL